MRRRLLPAGRAARAALGVALALVVLCASGEAVVRRTVAERVTAALGGRLGGSPDVSLGARPALLTLLDGTLPTVTVAGRANAAGFTGIPVTAVLSGAVVDRSRHTAEVSGSRVTAEVSTAAVTRRLASTAGQGGAAVSGVTAEPASGTLELAVRGGLATVRVRPAVHDSRLSLSVVDGEVLGSAAPAALLDRVRSRVDSLAASGRREGRDGAVGALGLRLKDVTVTDEGLRLVLTGGAATLDGSGS
ncbi:LmeA family phospholipid-binding protein [Streptomyces sp. NPDC048385]|uniref:LmeA family phospholipid-binding protein n=1 Tax=Streptomyces sp. NPDC048385 TaxID=3155145 RepID=UPI003444B0DB